MHQGYLQNGQGLSDLYFKITKVGKNYTLIPTQVPNPPVVDENGVTGPESLMPDEWERKNIARVAQSQMAYKQQQQPQQPQFPNTGGYQQQPVQQPMQQPQYQQPSAQQPMNPIGNPTGNPVGNPNDFGQGNPPIENVGDDPFAVPF